jgi:CBS domain-containing protein
MKTVETLHRSGVGVQNDTTIRAGAAVMNSAGVGALAVLDGERLVGIVTDRDLVRRGIARGVALDARIDAVMSTPVVTIQAETDVHEAYALFRRHPVRRLPVVRGWRFIGMITIDDLLVALASDLADLVRPVAAEALFAHRDAAVPATS